MKLSINKLVYLSLLLYVFSCFFSTTMMTISFIAGSVSIVLDLLIKFFKKQKISIVFCNKSKLLILLLLLMTALQILLGFVHQQEFNLLKSVFEFYKDYFSLFWILYIYQNLDDDQVDFKRGLLLTLLSASLISSTYILLQYFGLFELGINQRFGILSQPYTSSGLILAGIFASLYFYKIDEKPSLFPAIFQVVALLLLGQISSIAGFILGFLLINFKYKVVSFKLLSLISLIFIALFLFTAKNVPRLERKLGWFTSIEKLMTNKSVACRFALWQTNFDALKEKLWLGNGKITRYTCVTKAKENSLSHAHNIFLHQLFTGGIFKLVTWLLFYLSLFFFLLKIYTEDQIFLGYFIALSVEGIFEYWWGDSEVKNLFLILMFLAILVTKNKAKSE